MENFSSVNFNYSYECENEQSVIKSEIQKERQYEIKVQFDNVCAHLHSSTLRSLTLACEKGVSKTLTGQLSLPLSELGFVFHNSAFRDALSLRYGWCPQDIPTQCVCGTVSHFL